MGEIRTTLKKNLIRLLSDNGMSQKELAIKLCVSQAAVTNWIKGKNSPDLATLEDICKVLDVSLMQLFDCDYSTKDGAPPVTADEYMMIQRYRILDEHGKDVLSYLLNKEYERVVQITGHGILKIPESIISGSVISLPETEEQDIIEWKNYVGNRIVARGGLSLATEEDAKNIDKLYKNLILPTLKNKKDKKNEV